MPWSQRTTMHVLTKRTTTSRWKGRRKPISPKTLSFSSRAGRSGSGGVPLGVKRGGAHTRGELGLETLGHENEIAAGLDVDLSFVRRPASGPVGCRGGLALNLPKPFRQP